MNVFLITCGQMLFELESSNLVIYDEKNTFFGS